MRTFTSLYNCYIPVSDWFVGRGDFFIEDKGFEDGGGKLGGGINRTSGGGAVEEELTTTSSVTATSGGGGGGGETSLGVFNGTSSQPLA